MTQADSDRIDGLMCSLANHVRGLQHSIDACVDGSQEEAVLHGDAAKRHLASATVEFDTLVAELVAHPEAALQLQAALPMPLTDALRTWRAFLEKTRADFETGEAMAADIAAGRVASA